MSTPQPQESLASKPNLPIVNERTNPKTLTVFVGGVAVGAIVGVSGFAVVNNFVELPKLDLNYGKDSNVMISSSTSSQILEMVKYKDGVYTAQAEYEVEATGSVHVLQIEVFIKNGEIVAAKTVEIEDGEEVVGEYLQKFNDELSGKIIGEPIEDIAQMELVSGSTLTSDAFKVALAEVQIDAEAKQAADGMYEDGDYYGQAFFGVPVLGEDEEGNLKGHTIGVKLTIKDGLVENVVVNEVDTDGTVIENERFDQFDTEVEGVVIGETIDSIQDLDIVNGASYTTQGFNDAVKLIYEQAKIN